METDRHAIVNPERAEAADELTERIAVDVHQPASADGLSTAAARAVDAGADVVVAVGGDGTQRTVAEAVAHTDSELAVVPGGTVNLLGRVLGVESIDDAAAAIERGEARPLDLARCDDRAFVLNSSTGLDAEIIARTGDGAKRFGRLGYTAVGLRELARASSGRCTVDVDGETVFDDEALTVLVLNVGERGSARFTIAPGATPDDGLLDVVVVRGRRSALIRAGLARMRGRVPRHEDAVIARGRSIRVRWDDAVAVQCDGDAIGRCAAVTYTVEPSAVAVRT